MDVFVEKENYHKKFRFSGNAEELLTKLDINPETVLIVKNGELITEKDNIRDKDSVKLLSVISGG